ncbi:MAG: restriction endonuclease subunit S [Proteobacteria bacterium]|nr:restriction endonuclease subunit S [Pseudomonadota bacterium]
MSKWEIKKLDDISDMCLGKMLDKSKNKGELQPYLANINVRWGAFDFKNLSKMRFEKSESERYGLQHGDLVVCEGGEPGRCAIWKNEVPSMKIQKALHRVRINEKYSKEFVYYRFLLAGRNGELRKHFIGSTIKHLTGVGLKQVEFGFPLLKEQKNIAAVLSALDAKITLNNRINAELETMAKTLYDYWFVQFDFPDKNSKPYKSSGGKMVWNEELKREIPEGWDSCQLSDIISYSGTGLNPRDNFKLGSGENYYITIKNIQNGKIVLDDKCDRINDEALKIIDKRSELRPGDILFTSIEPVGMTYLIQEKPINWNINESVFTIRPNYKKVSSEFLLTLLSSSEMKAFTKNQSYGSIHKGIRHGVLKTFKLPYHDSSLINDFSTIIKPILKRIYNLDTENQHLSSLRDWLLPMLMNGQVKVS